MVDTFSLEIYGCRTGSGIVKPNYFERASVARAFFINYNYTVIRLLTRAHARQSDH